MKNLLITGATSFLGKSVITRLEKNTSYNVVKTSLKGDQKNNIISLDLRDEIKTRALLLKTKPEIILHFAAFVNLTRDFVTAKHCVDANIMSTLNLLEATKKVGVKKIIFASTEEVYGTNKTPYKESQIPKPPSMYSISKIAGENLCEYYSKLHDFCAISLRFGTFFGPASQSDRFLTTLIKSALSHEQIRLNSGKFKRDYIFIDDAVDAIMKALSVNFTHNEIINIGGKRSVTLLSFVHKIIKAAKSTSVIKLNVFPERIGEPAFQKMDISKAKKVLRWEPTTSLDDGIKKSVDFFSQNNYHVKA